MLTLGIETSCDETSAAVIKGADKILSNKTASSLSLHKKYGGVIPEIACRYHLECINYVIKEALDTADVDLKDIGLVAVTHGPGLTGALLIGISAAKALSFALSIPIIGVNHLYAHIYSAIIGRKKLKFPCVGLVVSGGHTSLVLMSGYNKFKLLGQTRDDACGEALDKAAKALKLGYPGGPIIEKKAKSGNPEAINFPRAYMEKGSLDFSFSGVKTALLYYIGSHLPAGQAGNIEAKSQKVNDICASFQKALFDVIVDKAIDACVKNKVSQLLVGGGVSANKTLQGMLTEKGEENELEIFLPQGNLYTDNAAMVAVAGYRLYKEGMLSDYSLDTEPNLGIG